MPIYVNTLGYIIRRWLSRGQASSRLTTVDKKSDRGGHPSDRRPRRGQAPPPMSIAFLSAHLRRDIGLDSQ